MRNDETVHNGFDGVLLVTIETDLVVEAINLTVDAGPRKTRLADLFKDGLISSLASAHQGGKDQDTRPFGKFLDLIDNLLSRLLHHLSSANRTVRDTGACEQEPEIVIDFGNGAHRRTGVVGGEFLVNGDGGGEALDVIHIRFIHLPNEL